MLSELCQELRNWFSEDEDKHFGTFTISGGVITPSDFLAANQYFRIQGSKFNDGVYLFGRGDTLIAETFEGTVSAMRVPKDVIELSEEIDSWKEKYKNVQDSPYKSESFEGYSYTKDGKGDWRSVFASRLKRWRKI